MEITESEIRQFLLRNKIPLHMDLITPYEEEGFEAGYNQWDVDKDELKESVGKTIDMLQNLCGSKRKFDKQLREDLEHRILDFYETGYKDGEAFR